MQYTISQLYDHLFENIESIYDIFKGFFGEDYVDLQKPNIKYSVKNFLRQHGLIVPIEEDDTAYELTDTLLDSLKQKLAGDKAFIYIWWPVVTITNEYDKYVTIQDLYAKVDVQLDGRIPYENWGFLLNRATYTDEQFLSNYLHSHVCNIPKHNFTQFQQPCLGKGPIRETIGTLKNLYDETIWMLFCQELAMYVTVESISGVPYHRLEDIGKSSCSSNYTGFDFHNNSTVRFSTCFPDSKIEDFIKYYLKNGHLSFNFSEGRFQCGLSYYDYIIDVSNSFIDYFNKYLKKNRALVLKCFEYFFFHSICVKEGKFFKPNAGNDIYNFDAYRNRLVLKFKGKEIYTKITRTESSSATLSTVVDHNFAMFVLDRILRTINFRFKNEYNSRNERTAEVASVSERTVFL